MPTHYHLLVQTPDANLSGCMRHINGVYTQWYNVRNIGMYNGVNDDNIKKTIKTTIESELKFANKSLHLTEIAGYFYAILSVVR